MNDLEYINKELGTDYTFIWNVDWDNVSSDYKLSEEFIEKFQDKVNWFNISMYQVLSEPFIEKHKDDVDWKSISTIQKLSEAFIEKHKDKVDWAHISKFQKLSEPFIKKYRNRVDWGKISSYQKLSEPFIERFKNKVDWTNISLYQSLSESFIKKYKDRVDWGYITIYQALSESFIEKFQDKVDWYYISYYQKLSESFIEKYKNKLDWYNIVQFQKLSDEFIKNSINNIDVCFFTRILMYQTLSESTISLILDKYFPLSVNKDEYSTLLIYQKLSDEFIEKYNLTINKDKLWQYKDTEFKKQKLIETGKYECYDDYFIAYKAIRPDRYSLYNFQYQYLPGKTYESNCDCTDDDNSFGLSVGTYDFAENYSYLKFGLIVKCKIYYKDIGRVVHGGDKVRCFKITILD